MSLDPSKPHSSHQLSGCQLAIGLAESPQFASILRMLEDASAALYWALQQLIRFLIVCSRDTCIIFARFCKRAYALPQALSNYSTDTSAEDLMG
jgi:hypothetical protein